MTEEETTLPEGAGRMPQWWLEVTPHDTMEKAEYEAKVKKEADERDLASQAEAEAALNDLVQQNLHEDENEDDDEEDKVDSTELAKAFLAASKPVEGSVERGPSEILPPASSHDASDEIASRRANLKHVETKAPAELTSSEAVMVGAISEAHPISPGLEEQVSPAASTGEQSTGKSIMPVGSTGSTPSPTKRERKTFKTAFTGVSPFDFAMQQRVREKERREKEREARESLAHHHAQQVTSDRASELKALNLEQKKKKKEAEEALKSFKDANLGSEFSAGSELSKIKTEQRAKKKEAEEIQHGYKG